MEMTTRSLWTMVHGMGVGALYLLACSGALMELWRMKHDELSERLQGLLRWYLVGMAVLAWAAVLMGAYVVYPWYRAVPPAGTSLPAGALGMYPQRLLMASTTTSGWHNMGMEWKEHIAWFVPMATTMVAAVFLRYGRALRQHRQLHAVVLLFALAAFGSAGVAGFFGAMINKYAPVQGGATVQISRGGAQ